ncbi:hypothetical protein, partial [Rhodococcus sp. (in: high G+C Gram-positive bacteria)]|uniref:hypothetical protein n=1 Tax=Rhodococcus sp. TaxID=1831 RepID=UPI00388EB865
PPGAAVAAGGADSSPLAVVLEVSPALVSSASSVGDTVLVDVVTLVVVGVLVAVESSLPQADRTAVAAIAAASAPKTRVERERVRAGMWWCPHIRYRAELEQGVPQAT